MRLILTVLVIPAAALAQGQMPTEFPDDAAPIAADALQGRMAGEVFTGRPINGPGWRLEYKSSGYAFVDTTTGFHDSGKWRVEDSSSAPSGGRPRASAATFASRATRSTSSVRAGKWSRLTPQ